MINDIMLNIPNKIKPKTEVRQKKDQKQEYKFIGSIILIPGLTLWQFQESNGKLTKVEIKREVSIGYDKKAKKTAKAISQPGCLYVQALNRKNAIKKINKYYRIQKQLRDEKEKLSRENISK